MTYFRQNNALIRLEQSGEGFIRTEIILFSGGDYKCYHVAKTSLTKDKAIDILSGCSPSSEDKFNKALSEAKDWINGL